MQTLQELLDITIIDGFFAVGSLIIGLIVMTLVYVTAIYAASKFNHGSTQAELKVRSTAGLIAVGVSFILISVTPYYISKNIKLETDLVKTVVPNNKNVFVTIGTIGGRSNLYITDESGVSKTYDNLHVIIETSDNKVIDRHDSKLFITSGVELLPTKVEFINYKKPSRLIRLLIEPTRLFDSNDYRSISIKIDMTKEQISNYLNNESRIIDELTGG